MQKQTFSIPEWGKMTCVVGWEHKAGNYNGRDYDFYKLYGVSEKTVENGSRSIFVSEEFKIKSLPNGLSVGDVVNLIFDRNGQVVSLIKYVGKEND